MFDRNIGWQVRFGVILSLFIALMFFTPSGTIFVEAADTIIVDDDGTGDYTTIQAAINNAGVGDNIVVKDGTYAEQLTVNVPSISIAAASGETPVIYVSSHSIGIDITAPDVLIDGFEIFGNASESGLHPAIRASSGSNGLIVSKNNFKAFTGQKGNLAFLVTDTAIDITFTINTVTNYKYAVSLDGVSWTDVSSNAFTNVDIDVYHAAQIAGDGEFRDRYYGSIQYAIDSSSAYKTIGVMPGTFMENVIVNKSLVILGAQNGVSPVGGRTGYESIIDGNTMSAITIATGTSNVVVDGFTLTVSNKLGTSNQAGVLIGNNTDDITVNYNIIENITDGLGSDTVADETYGIMIYGCDETGSQTGITISSNMIRNVEEYGIAINDKTSDVTISGNLITDLIGSDHSSDPDFDPSWPSLVCSAIHLGGQVGPIETVTIDNNILNTNVTGNGDTTAAGSGISFTGVPERTNLTRVWEGFEQIIITDNDIIGNTIGILALAGEFNDTLSIGSNSIYNNYQFGINNTLVNSTFNATNNWWGNISGPYHPTENPDGTGNNISDNITFWPWYEFDAYSIEPTVTLEIGYPKAEYGLYVTSDTPFSLEASDYESGMHSFTYRVWDTTQRWSNWSNYTSSFKLIGEGKHMIQYNATDNAGTKNSDKSIHFVDNEGPWIELQEPSGGEYIRGALAIRWESADQILDQCQTLWTDFVSLSGDYPGHIQSFEPTHDTLNAVDLLLHGDEAEITVTIFSDIYPVPIPVGQATKHLENIGTEHTPQWATFTFDSEINLETYETYYIGITQEIISNTGFSWYYYNSTGSSDPYLFGQSWIKKTDALELHPEYDWAFKTSYWNTGDVTISIQYTNSIPPIWSTFAEGEDNDGEFIWDTSTFPDSPAYKIRVLATDPMGHVNSDESNPFTIDNKGPSIYNVIITDTTLGSSEYTKNGDRIELSATIDGDIYNITADLSGFGKGSSVEPNSLYGDTATWVINSINCIPSDGEITAVVTVYDPTGDFGQNSGSIIADNTPPTVEITRPMPGIYIMDGQRILPYPYPVIIGQMTIKIDADDMGAGIEKVDVYIDGKLRGTYTEEPYECLWDEASIGFFKIKAIALDQVGFNATVAVNDVFILNFDILN